jgi:hypothetical protein
MKTDTPPANFNLKGTVMITKEMLYEPFHLELLNLPSRRPYTTIALVLSDATALLLSVAISVAVKALLRGPVQLSS